MESAASIARGAISAKSPQSLLRRSTWKLLLAAMGPIGATILGVATLWISMLLNGLGGAWLYQVAVALILIRVWYSHTRGPEPVLTNHRIRKRVWRTVVDEGKISLVFLAVCFVMPWPFGLEAATTFVLGNIILQLWLMNLSRLLIKVLAKGSKIFGWTEVVGQRALIIGTGATAKKVADMVSNSPELDTRVVGFLDYAKEGFWRFHDIPLIGHPDDLEKIVANSQVDAVFWAVEPEDVARSWKLMETAEKMGVRVFVMPSFYNPTVSRVRPTYINGMPALVYRSDPESQVGLLAKSILDRIGAILGLLLFAPIMAIVAGIVKLDSRGPVLFSQTRSGRNGRPFKLYKFRTMCSDAEVRKKDLLSKNEMSGPVFKMKEDPRITPVGRFLRKYSIDELPQFINVLKGEMSLVGPRPPLPQEVSRYEPWQHRKLAVKPGLTCLWQVNGRNDIDFDEWMRLDLRYIDNWSIWLDTKILAKTLPAVLKGSGR